MASNSTNAQRGRLAQETRERFVADAGRAMVELCAAVQDRLTTLLNEAAPSRELQIRRDVWTFYQRCRANWLDGTKRVWHEALNPDKVVKPKPVLELGSFELVGNEVVENKIVASRLVLGVMEKVSGQLDDLRLRIKYLENSEELEGNDILRPEVLVLLMVEQWAVAGMPRDAWPMVNDVVHRVLTERLKDAYTKCNEFLIKQGVMPTIELKDRVKRAPSGAGRAPGVGRATAPADGQAAPDSGGQSQRGDLSGGSGGGYAGGQAGFGGSGGHGGGYAATVPGGPGGGNTGAMHAASGESGGAPMPAGPGAGQASRGAGGQGGRAGWADEQASAGYGQTPGGAYAQGSAAGSAHGDGPTYGGGNAAEETRMMTSTTPLARARSRAQGVMGQLKRLLIGRVSSDFDATTFQPASPALAAALARPAGEGASATGSSLGGATQIEDYSPAGVARVAGQLREQTTELKKKAETKTEKATIEIVALMFQAILQEEERIPPGIRVWFARLQMPVLRVALAEPEFFGTINHPARQLIDRLGSCVMGFDASGIQGGALELEVKRIVQVIEQYPETGKRVFLLVYEEFQKFLAKYLTEKGATQKVVSVAQQVEQKETLTIQYTIEMRNMLKDIPVRDEIRTFLFKVWAEVLAVAAVRKGPQHRETLDLKKSSTDLVWAASAKPNRSDRARVISDLPKLLQRLRSGMTLLGLSPSEQDAHIKTVSDTLADAFLSKTQAIPQAQIEAMAQRLANLEDFVSEDGMGDLPLDAENIEMMLGIDASTIDVVADGGSKPSHAMLAWAQELQLGSWFTLDHNGRVTQVQFAWRSDRKQLHLFASTDGHSYLIQAGRLAAYLQAGLLLPQEEEALTVRATRTALAKIEANPERLLG